MIDKETQEEKIATKEDASLLAEDKIELVSAGIYPGDHKEIHKFVLPDSIKNNPYPR